MGNTSYHNTMTSGIFPLFIKLWVYIFSWWKLWFSSHSSSNQYLLFVITTFLSLYSHDNSIGVVILIKLNHHAMLVNCSKWNTIIILLITFNTHCSDSPLQEKNLTLVIQVRILWLHILLWYIFLFPPCKMKRQESNIDHFLSNQTCYHLSVIPLLTFS